MAGTGRPGVEPLSGQRAWFARLIAQGVSNTDACRTVGVNRRTGTRWRFGRSVPTAAGSVREYPPVFNKPVVVLSPRFLSENERAVIAHEHDRGTTVRATAMLLGRSPSTASRELRRNTDPAGVYGRPSRTGSPGTGAAGTGYGALPAVACCGSSSSSTWTCDEAPEQIAATLRLEWPDDPRRQLSTESLYQALYARDGVLVRSLCTGRHQRRPHQRGDSRRPRARAAAADALDRAAAGSRRRPGRGRPFRGRPHYGRVEPDRDCHPGGTQQPKRHSRARRREPHCGRVVRVPGRGVHRDAAGAGPVADLGPGQGDELSP